MGEMADDAHNLMYEDMYDQQEGWHNEICGGTWISPLERLTYGMPVRSETRRCLGCINKLTLHSEDPVSEFRKSGWCYIKEDIFCPECWRDAVSIGRLPANTDCIGKPIANTLEGTVMDSEYRYEVGDTVECAFTGDHYFIKGRWLDDNGVPVYKGVASNDGDYMLFRECEVKEIV